MIKERYRRLLRHEVDRLSFDVDRPFDDFRQRYEQAVPPPDQGRIKDLVQRGASWKEVEADAVASAPFGFLIYWKLDAAPLMGLAGHSGKGTEYLGATTRSPRGCYVSILR